MSDKEAEQAALPLHEKPAFASTEVEPALKSLKNLWSKLSKKPAPKKEKPVKAENATEGASTGGDGQDPASDGENRPAEDAEEARTETLDDAVDAEGSTKGMDGEDEPSHEHEL